MLVIVVCTAVSAQHVDIIGKHVDIIGKHVDIIGKWVVAQHQSASLIAPLCLAFLLLGTTGMALHFCCLEQRAWR